jgi:hypothetical protein
VNLMTGVDFDPESKTATFSGSVGLSMLMHLLLKAKFGEPFHGDILLNPWVNGLIREVDAASGQIDELPRRPDPRGLTWDDEFLTRLGFEIVAHASKVGYWSMSREDQRTFICDEAAAPHRLAEADIEFIFDAIEEQVQRAERLTRLARNRSGQP